jgi:hypothetical protein
MQRLFFKRFNLIVCACLSMDRLNAEVSNDDISPLKRIEFVGIDKPRVGWLVGTIQKTGFGKYPWHKNIKPFVFYIGEESTPIDHRSKKSSIWDPEWQKNYGGYDTPDSDYRNSNFAPNSFLPNQNPFYIQLPYSDIQNGHTKTEASQIIPWFKNAFDADGKSVLKGRWVAIFSAGRTCFAQWEDSGPYSDDDWKYVFGGNTPDSTALELPAIGLSPAIRDYLQLDNNATCAWKFVDYNSVPDGPWKYYGNNNTFFLMRRGKILLLYDRNNTLIRPGVPVENNITQLTNTNNPQASFVNENNNVNSFPLATYPPSAIPTIHYMVIGIAAYDGLNLHTGPGSSYPVCYQIAYDATGITKCELPVMNGDTEWVKIEYQGVSGYVVQNYLKPQ